MALIPVHFWLNCPSPYMCWRHKWMVPNDNQTQSVNIKYSKKTNPNTNKLSWLRCKTQKLKLSLNQQCEKCLCVHNFTYTICSCVQNAASRLKLHRSVLSAIISDVLKDKMLRLTPQGQRLDLWGQGHIGLEAKALKHMAIEQIKIRLTG